jgi:glycosyltransferase involved in cell wall biosynthesis
MRKHSRIALIHDWLNQVGGAENVLETLVRMFPGAPVFTSMYAPGSMPECYRSWDIRTTFMQRLPGVTTHHQAYLPVYPFAFSRVDLLGYDLILSNKSGFCHGVPVPPGAAHICYCLAPTRYLWQYETYREREDISPAADLLLRPALSLLRRWDYIAAQRVHHFIAISAEIQSRIRRFYGRESKIIYPPVEVGDFLPVAGLSPANGAQMQAGPRLDTPKPDRDFAVSGPRGDYYLAGGRLIPYKRTDLAVRACSELGLKLLVYGDGRDRLALEQLAGPTVSFLGRVSRAELVRLFEGARAFIFPGLEDFGIAPVEAQAAGRPVIAFAGGGALDTVIAGRTGEFFAEQTVQSLTSVLSTFNSRAYDPAACRANAERFSAQRFRQELSEFIQRHAGVATP